MRKRIRAAARLYGLTFAALVLAGCSRISGDGTAAETPESAAEMSTETEESTEAGDTRSYDHPQLVPVGREMTSLESVEIAESSWIYGTSATLVPADASVSARYPGLSSAMLQVNQELNERAESRYQKLKDYVGTLTEDEIEDVGSFNIDTALYFLRSDTNTVSFVQHIHTGGSDESQMESADMKVGVNIDPMTGDSLALGDFVADLEGLKSLFLDAAASRLGIDPADPNLTAEADRLLTADRVSSEELSFAVGHESIMFYMNTDASFSFAGGAGRALDLCIPFAGNSDIFTDRALYTTSRWVQEVDCLPYGDGPETVYGEFRRRDRATAFSFGYDLSDEMDMINPVVTLGDQEYGLNEIEELGYYAAKCVLARTGNGNTWLCLTIRGSNDYITFQVYDLMNGCEFIGREEGKPASDYSPVQVNEQAYDREAVFLNPEDFILTSISQFVGTASVYRHYGLNPNSGAIETKESDYTYSADNSELTLKKDLTGEKVVLENAGGVPSYRETGETVTIPAGTVVTRKATDENSRVILALPDGTYAAFTVSVGDGGWPITIDGTDVEELFDGIYFAG